MISTCLPVRATAVSLVALLALLPSAEVLADLPATVTSGSCIGLKRAAALASARATIFDLERLEPHFDDPSRIAAAARLLQRAAIEHPAELRSFLRAFLTDASPSERGQALDRFRKLGFADVGDDPVAIWGVIAIAAIAILVGSGCDEGGGCGSTDCTDPDAPCGGSSDSSSGDG